jgi:hypothetical protein
MEALNQNINHLKIDNQFAWLMTISLLIIGFPLFKNTLMALFLKVYELFIQQAF